MDKNKSKPTTTVAALIKNSNNKFLFLKSYRWSERWSLPAGKVESGERLIDSIKRETLEETGLIISNIKFLKIQEIINAPDFHEHAHFISHAFYAESKHSDVIISNEFIEYCWVDISKAHELRLNTPTLELVEHFLKNIYDKNNINTIIIDKLQINCIIGIQPDERINEQPIFLTLKIKSNQSKTTKSDRIEDTIDYVTIVSKVKQIVISKKYQLLETLVEDVAKMILNLDGVSEVVVRAEKPNAITEVEYCSVEINRSLVN